MFVASLVASMTLFVAAGFTAIEVYSHHDDGCYCEPHQ
jgi:hypothetical protein